MLGRFFEEAGWDTGGDSLRWGATSSVGGIAKLGAGTKARTGLNASTNAGAGVENEVRVVLRGHRQGWSPGTMTRTTLDEVRICSISPSFILYHHFFMSLPL